MRIWLINQYSVPPCETGHTRHYYLAKALIDMGHEARVIASNYSHFSNDYLPDTDPKHCTHLEYDGVPFTWLPTTPYKGNSLARLKNMAMFALNVMKTKHYQTLERPDIIIGSSPHPFAAHGAKRLAKKYNVPFVFEIRDFWPESLMDLGNISAHHPFILLVKAAVKHLYQQADHIITLLPNSAPYLQTFGVCKERITWAPNFINQAMIPAPIQAKPSTPFTLMYAGAHGLANNLMAVLEAIRQLNESGVGQQLCLKLIGDGPEKAQLQQYASTHNLDNVVFLDPVPKAQIFDVLNTADAYLVLLQNSPVFALGISPNKLFDYLAMGRPVICNIDAPIHPDPTLTLTLNANPKTPNSLAKTIESLLTMSETERQQIGDRGKQAVNDFYELNSVAKTVEQALQATMDCATTNSLADTKA